MAKNDKSHQQNQLNAQVGLGQNNLDNLRNQTTPLYQGMAGNYQRGVNQSFSDYGNLQDAYRAFLGSNSPTNPFGSSSQNAPQGQTNSADGSAQSIRSYLTSHGGTGNETDYWVGKWPELVARGQQLGNPNYAMERLSQAEELGGGSRGNSGSNQGPAFGGYQSFAENGGFSPQDIQDMRARAIAPTRAIYQNLTDDLTRQKNLSGGYMPNFGAAASRLGRQANYAISDANVNSNAALAQMVQQGKLAGLSGMTGIDQFGRNLGFQNQQLEQQGNLANRQMNLSGINAMTNLYGQQPGLAQLYGQQALGANAQNIDIQQLQQALNQMAITGQNANSQIPGNFGQAMGNIGSVLGLAGQVGGVISGMPGLFGGGRAGISGLPGGSRGPF